MNIPCKSGQITTTSTIPGSHTSLLKTKPTKCLTTRRDSLSGWVTTMNSIIEALQHWCADEQKAWLIWQAAINLADVVRTTRNYGMTELKPCPFCGEKAELDTLQGYRNYATGRMEHAIAIYCSCCTATISVCIPDVPDITWDQVVDMWNR